ncbi:DUF1561 family protein [Helicobacter mastomyrinus]|uniref:DUF1561 family protein n=1 Tax=Helicobacter mastomyrinus TaxID=287948 RepID=A0ABZ3F5C5_9HELI
MKVFIAGLCAIIFGFCLFLFFKAENSPSSFSAIPAPTQKLADSPKDKIITFQTSPDTLIQCLTPIFRQNESYVGISDCQNAQEARYDVFSHIAWNYNDVWLCMSGQNEDYAEGRAVVLRPCVIDDKTQSFVIKDNTIYTPDMNYQLHLSNNILSFEKPTSTKPKVILHHMQEWSDTIATPPPLNLKSFMAWSFISSGEFDLYYITNDESIKNDPQDLYFNVENNTIALYHPENGKLTCLTSLQTTSQAWNWVDWESCTNTNTKPNQRWELFLFCENDQAMLKDYLGNFLRVTKYGVHWGVPYTAKPDYLAKDTGQDQTSYFRFSHNLQDWQRFKNGNLSDSLPVCPANGTNAKTQKLLILPPSFVLSDEWKRRLYDIATTTDGVLDRAGDCGVCLLHSYQMIAELTEYTYVPLELGGFFFDTLYGHNPFISFRNRYPLLAASLEQYQSSNIPRGLSRAQTFEYVAQMYRSVALTLFPGHFWMASEFASSDITIRSNLRDLFEQPSGTLWIVQMYYTTPDGARHGHAMPALRTSDGVLFIPTNFSNGTYEEYQYALNASLAHNLRGAYNIISNNGRHQVYMLYTLRLREIYPNPITSFVSNNNCTGEGEDRRGSASMPLSTMINQCVSGRCVVQ